MVTISDALIRRASRQACPRCRGRLLIEYDDYGHFITCLQCSKTLSEEEEQKLLGLPPQAASPIPAEPERKTKERRA